MEYQRIKFFMAACRTLNFAQAARQLYITPQALAKQIGLMEQDLGMVLFTRTTRVVKLTKQGAFLFEKFSEIERQMEQIIGEARKIPAENQEIITIGVFSAIPKLEVVAPIISYVRVKMHNVQLEVVTQDLTLMKESLSNNKLDMCITNTSGDERWGDMEMFGLARYPAKLAVSLYHPWAIKEKIELEDMKQMTFLGLERHEPQEQKNFYRNVVCKNKIMMPNFDTLLMNLDMGNAFGIFPEIFEQSSSKKYKFFDLPGKQMVIETVCVISKFNKKRLLHQVYELIQEEFEIHECTVNNETDKSKAL